MDELTKQYLQAIEYDDYHEERFNDIGVDESNDRN